jgi:hypothetical protein
LDCVRLGGNFPSRKAVIGKNLVRKPSNLGQDDLPDYIHTVGGNFFRMQDDHETDLRDERLFTILTLPRKNKVAAAHHKLE